MHVGMIAEDPRVRARITDSGPWQGVIARSTVDSTQDVALEAVRARGHAGVVVLADTQTVGRGRRGRAWLDTAKDEAAPGNLAMTVTVADNGPQGHLVPLAAGVGVVAAVGSWAADARLKWPNDVLVDGRKLAGILVERHQVADGQVLLVGVGINVDWRDHDRPPVDGDPVSLADLAGGPVDRPALVAALLDGLADAFARLDAGGGLLQADYRAVCDTIGRTVQVTLPGDDAVVGRAITIDDEGRLVVDAGGRRHAFVAGDVEHVRGTP